MTLPLTTFMYHYVRPATEMPSAGYGGTDVEVFDRQLDEICRHATPVDLPAVVAALDGRAPLPADAVLLTFDDGLADHARYVLPRLAARGLSGVFFVLARAPSEGLTLGHRLHVLIAALGSVQARDAIVEGLTDEDRKTLATLEAEALALRPDDPEDAWKRPLQRELSRAVEPAVGRVIRERIGAEDELARELYLSESQLDELAGAGMHLGGHGREHLWLDFEDADTVRSELRASRQLLDGFVDTPLAFAYPYGGVSDEAAAEVERAGFRAAFTTAPESYGPFRLGRIDGDGVAPPDGAQAVRA